MLDLGSQTRMAMAWSETATNYMRVATAMSVSNMGAITDFWSGGLGGRPNPWRNPFSTAMPWYRQPERNPFDPTAWFTAMMPPAMPFGMAAFAPPAPWSGMPGSLFGAQALPGCWPMPMVAAMRGAMPTHPSAAVPALLALVATGMAAQQALSLIEASRMWQAAPVRQDRPSLPSYRSDSGHAVASIVMPEAVSAAALPLTGFAIFLRMMQAMSAR